MATPKKKVEQTKATRTLTTTEVDEKINKRGTTGTLGLKTTPNKRLTVVSNNRIIDMVGETLIDVYEYVLMTDLVDGGLNAVELKGNHPTLGEHLVCWNLDNENAFEYIICTPKELRKDETDKLKLYVKNLVNGLIEEFNDDED